jgi:hypothetical protein
MPSEIGTAAKNALLSILADKCCCCCAASDVPMKRSKLSAAFFTKVLRESNTISSNTEVRDFDADNLSGVTGLMSEMYRISLSYAGEGSDSKDLPQTIIIKFSSPAFGQRFVASWLSFYKSEIGFYNSLAPHYSTAGRVSNLQAHKLIQICTNTDSAFSLSALGSLPPGSADPQELFRCC